MKISGACASKESSPKDANGWSARALSLHAPVGNGARALLYAMSTYPCSFGSNVRGGAAPATKCETSPAPSARRRRSACGDIAGSATSSAALTTVVRSTANARRNHTRQSPAWTSGYFPSATAGAASCFSSSIFWGSSMSNGVVRERTDAAK